MPAVPAALVFLAWSPAQRARHPESVRANVVMTVIELSGWLLVIVLGAVVLGRGDGDVGRVMQFPEGVSASPAVFAAALLAFYSFVGFETSANVAEEVRNSGADLSPRAVRGLLSPGWSTSWSVSRRRWCWRPSS